MVDKNELIEEFSFMGIEKLNDDIITKCIEIAVDKNINAERFVEEWIAFAQTNLGGNLQPTLPTLDTMVRLQFDKKPEKMKSDIKTNNSLYSNMWGMCDEEVNMCGMWGEEDISDIRIKIKSKNNEASENKPTVWNKGLDYNLLLNESFSGKPSTTYAERTDRGQVIRIFGEHNLKIKPDTTDVCVSIKLLDSYELNSFKYMFETPDVEATAMDNRIDIVGKIFREKYFPKAIDENQINNADDATVATYGRIRCDGNGKLNPFSVLLETTLYHRNGRISPINLDHIPSYALFPGQIVILNGYVPPHAARDVPLNATKLYSNMLPSLTPTPELIHALRIVIGCGPFTLSENLSYEPLNDLIQYVLNEKPHVLILVGPFVPENVTQSLKMHFDNLMELITSQLRPINTHIIFMASYLDAHHHYVYPTPPFQTVFSNDQLLHFAGDPCRVEISGVQIGLTSADILLDLAKMEMRQQPMCSDRMTRLAEHVLGQGCFYPVYPPEQGSLPVDQQLLGKYGCFDTMPHILVLPSKLGQFIKNVNGCLVINPGRLSQQFAGGTFARIDIFPGQTDANVIDHAACQIIKI